MATEGRNSDAVYRILRERIASGALAPRTRLVELSLAEDLGVSRTPIREALMRLSAEKLIVADAAGGMIVPARDSAEVEEIFVVRDVLDGLAARLATYRITTSQLQRLRVVNRRMSEALLAGRRDQALVANDLFHDLLYRAARNPILTQVGSDLRDAVRLFNTFSQAAPGRMGEVVTEHKAIVEALEGGDPEAAERASRRHLAAAREQFVRLQIQAPDDEEPR
jgi:DNA-binding GntR family transcriptional regulator